MYKILANTLFMGKEIVFMPHCQSTNSEAIRLCAEKSIGEGAVVVTDHQQAGRGQRGNSWESAAGLNLTFSTVLKPAFLAIPQQFLLNVIASLALTDLMTEDGIEDIRIKWPNDLYINSKKVAGILIENQLSNTKISSSIVGIGLNVNQEIFHYENATSLRSVTRRDYVLSDVLIHFLAHLEARYLKLRSGNHQQLLEEYEASLYWRYERHTFYSEGENFEGVIMGINHAGQLLVDAANEERCFGIQQITYIS